MEFSSSYFLNPKTELRKSPIGGSGLFAKEKIAKGEVVYISEGRTLTHKEEESLSQEAREHCYDVDGTHIFCPKDFRNMTPDWYTNHSCEPNCGYADSRAVVAMRDMDAGEEIVLDYATDSFYPRWHMKCHCGVKTCRKIIRGNDWKNPVLQKKYRGFFQPYLQQKI